MKTEMTAKKRDAEMIEKGNRREMWGKEHVNRRDIEERHANSQKRKQREMERVKREGGKQRERERERERANRDREIERKGGGTEIIER